jgi:hypothetical protein
MSVKDHVEEIKSILNTIILSKRKKEEYHAENPDDRRFSIPFPLKVKFDQSYSIYRDNKIYISRVYKQT